MTSLFAAARLCLDACDPDEKLALTDQVCRDWAEGNLDLNDDTPVALIPVPGRPDHPKLVPPREVAMRGYKTDAERAALIHALTHIEFNAVNLGWDAVYRFRGMPTRFYEDWIQVAADEARHFSLLRERLRDLGYEYGDFPAHNGLWEMANKTADDVVARMAMVPRVLEARSLDVVPGIIRKLRGIGDQAAAEVLEIIEQDEVAHVAAGSRWFHYCCEQENLDPVGTFRELIDRFMGGRLKGPFKIEARRRAGFQQDEISLLEEFGG